MNPGGIREAFAPLIDEVDAALATYLKQYKEPASHYEMIRYHLGCPEDGPRLPSGKRLRALFSLLIGRACQAGTDAVNTLTLAAECLHAGSLVHDDLEDADEVRWGRPTVWKQFGMNQAINVGDAFIGMTYHLVLELKHHQVSDQVVLDILSTFNDTHLRMTEGQHLDLLYEGRVDITVDQYLKVIACKTAAACECVSHSSAILGGSDKEPRECYRKFGYDFGMLYQVCDDIHGLWTKEEDTGKAADRDVLLRKASLPMLLGYEQGSAELRALLSKKPEPVERRRRSPTVPRSVEFNSEEAQQIKEELTKLKIDDQSRQRAKQYLLSALDALKATGMERPEHQVLEAMTLMCAKVAGVEP